MGCPCTSTGLPCNVSSSRLPTHVPALLAQLLLITDNRPRGQTGSTDDRLVKTAPSPWLRPRLHQPQLSLHWSHPAQHKQPHGVLRGLGLGCTCTRARAGVRTHTRTHARTHTHTHHAQRVTVHSSSVSGRCIKRYTAALPQTASCRWPPS
jgi:hypothetical protein